MLTPKNNYENDTFLEKRYYQDFLSLAKDTNLLHVREAGLLLKDPEYTSSGKRLKYNLFEYVMDGEGYIYFDKIKYRVKKGDFIIVKKDINLEKDFGYGSNKENPYLKMWFTANGSYIDGLFTAFNITQPITIVPCTSLKAFQNFVMSFANNEYDQLASMTHILAILHAVFQGPRSDKQKTDGFDEMVDAYLEQNIRNHTTIDQAASALGVSPRHFAKYFKKRFDVTYSKYMYRQRMLFSKTLLQSNRYTISEIANHLGFCDQSYFSNCFYKEFGLYPNEYRKSVKVQTKSDK